LPGLGTLVNVVSVLLGAVLGVLLGHRLPQRTRDVVTDALGFTTLLIALLSMGSVRDASLTSYVGSSAPVLIVLGALVVGGIVGSLLRLEARIEGLGGFLQRRLSGRADAQERHRFIEGFVTASLVFCSGPMTIIGSVTEGLGGGSELLLIKSALDGFAAIAFAASFGWGVAASIVTVIAVQGSLTLAGVALGDVLPEAHVAAITATGGLLLVGIALRLLRIREVPVADLLPALLVAPALVAVAHAVV
jgi:uncharacterized membrane protein YqgA involved in biofilm formation